MKSIKRIIAQDSHRNGIGGAPFVVSLFKGYGEKGTFLGISFEATTGDSDEPSKRVRDFATHTAVLSVALTAEGNIGFAEGNSWRGSDYYGVELAEAWREKCRTTGDFPYDPFDAGWEPEGVSFETAGTLDGGRVVWDEAV